MVTTTSRPASGRGPRRVDARPDRRLAALSGLLAGAVALGVAELLSAFLAPSASPLVAVSGVFVDLTPAWLKEAAIQAFGTADKTVLLLTAAVVVAVLAAAAGVLAQRRRAAGYAVVVVLGVVAAAAAVSRPSTGPGAVLPSAVGALAGLVALDALLRRVPGDRGAAGPSPAPVGGAPGRPQGGVADRRSFLLAAGITAAVAVATGVGGRVAGAAGRSVSAARRALRLPVPAVQAPPVPPAVDLEVEGLEPWRTPAEDFYRIDTALVVPQVDPADWRLRVHGMVEEEVEIDFDELLDAPLVESWTTLTCVSNEVGGHLVGNARWLGLPIRDLLARARPLPGADMALSTSVDGFTASTPLDVLTTEAVDALLAVGMNGEPLPPEHGFPVRMVVPGLYGYVSATKWVVDIEVTRFADRTAYWTDRGWSERGPIRTQSRIDVPRPQADVSTGRVVVAGVAWAQERGVARVEVQADDGPWREAELGAPYNDRTWRQWRLLWDADPGTHRLRVRATDETGETQTATERPPAPDGATGWHTIVVDVSA